MVDPDLQGVNELTLSAVVVQTSMILHQNLFELFQSLNLTRSIPYDINDQRKMRDCGACTLFCPQFDLIVEGRACSTVILPVYILAQLRVFDPHRARANCS